MKNREAKKLIIPFFFWGCLAFVTLGIIIDSLTTLDKNITKIRLVIVDEPVFHFNGGDFPGPRFYSFSGERFKCDFRIADATLNVLENNEEIREKVKSIRFHDTIDVFIQDVDLNRLDKPKSVNVIGLLQNGAAIIDPVKVFEKDKEGVVSSVLLYSIICIIVAIWLIRRYLKVKAQRTTSVSCKSWADGSRVSAVATILYFSSGWTEC